MRVRTVLSIALTTALSVAGAVSAQTLSSGFTYQGMFADAGAPANGSYDFEFVLYQVASGGSALQTIAKTDVAVNGGLINTVIDFGAATFDGSVKYVEVHARPAGSPDPYIVLSPRQALTGVPYALGLPMPFQRSVHTGNQSAFRIQTLDGGTAIEGHNPTGTGFPAISGVSAGAVGVSGTGTTGVQGSGTTGVNGTGSTGVRGASETGDGVRGLGVIGVHGVGQIWGIWAQGGLLAEGNTNCNTTISGCSLNPVKTVLDIRNATIGNVILASSGTPSTQVFRVNGNGSVFANGDYNAGGADIAEYVPATGTLEPGDVVEIDEPNGDAFRLSSQPNSTLVGGVISTKPGVSLNSATADETAAKAMPRLALSGRVPVKVTTENGIIHAGDLLVSSSRPGHAMRAPESPRAGTVIGKAMQHLYADIGEIEMLVMLR